MEKKDKVNSHLDPERTFRYECEQAFLRSCYEKPNVEEEWKKFHSSSMTASKRTSNLSYFLYAVVAAMFVGFTFFLSKDIVSYYEIEEQKYNQLIASDSSEREIVIEELSQQSTETQKIDVDCQSKTMDCSGIVLSKKMADYRTADEKVIRHHIVNIPKGRMYHILLSDGTEVWLNADSRLSFPSKFSTAKRVVKLEGEAYFKVAKDENRPFVIETDMLVTHVLGTEFNVKAYKDSEHHVTLVEGSVEVCLAKNKRCVMLKPGEDIACFEDTYKIKQVDTQYYSHWMNGYFYFDDVALEDVLRDIGRWYNLSVCMEQDEALTNLRLHLVIERSEDIQQVVGILNAFQYLSVHIEDNMLKIERKK